MPQTLLAIGALLLFNTLIALLLKVLNHGSGFAVNLLISQCIGCSVAFTLTLLGRWMRPGWRRWLAVMLSLPIGVSAGIVLALLATSLIFDPVNLPRPSNANLLETLAIGLIFSIIGSTVFVLAERLYTADSELRQKRLEETERERRELTAHLKLLQAQIEPHFLFNTLANVASLIEVEPRQARQLLDRLISWLRLALVRVRSDHSSLGDELDLLENWLQILSLRFGSRLSWQFHVPAAARQLAFPPMLLQPLVENAVRHGIEPKLGGGSLQVIARMEAGRLRLEVHDDGVGLNGQGLGGSGAGLDNVGARLTALYGKEASCTLTSNSAGGVTAILEIPCVP